jgi:RIO kinase 2
MITDNNEILVFDFPQWISSDHPQYEYYLKRDIFNTIDFFRRRFGITADLEQIYEKFGI